ncbi:MAG: hypothetical protein K0R99_3814 [Microbacterium sp.]|jgi:hypothetical protein|nr:hypothetical protein [Microbacterium sp.]
MREADDGKSARANARTLPAGGVPTAQGAEKMDTPDCAVGDLAGVLPGDRARRAREDILITESDFCNTEW